MKTFETQYHWVDEEAAQQWVVEKNTNEIKDKVNTISHIGIEKELAEIFWLNNEKVKELARVETKELSKQNELTPEELQLAGMFWDKIYNKMLKLAENNKEQVPMTLASVMKDFDKFEHAA